MTCLPLTTTNQTQQQVLRALAAPVKRSSRRRIVLSPSKTASLLGRPQGKDLEDAVHHHANSRITLMYLLCVAVENSSGSDSSPNPGFEVKGAIAQGGRAYQKYHAAHDFVAGGIQDNILSSKIEHISSKKNITPNAKLILKSKGVSTPYLDRMRRNIDDPQKNLEILKELGLSSSLLSDTRIQRLLQTTVNLPYRINLCHDKRLENLVRSKELPDLLHKCYAGSITAEKATKVFIKTVRNHFEEKISDLESSQSSSVEDLEHYKLLLEGTPPEDCDLAASLGVGSSPEKRKLKRHLLSQVTPDPVSRKKKRI
ncbi:MAG: hypothetical protein ACI9S8_001804 [Chlamydiales bacterium]|jgi:hypothetical protein